MNARRRDDAHQVTGGCLCGAVRFSATLPDRNLSFCWCSQCRRQVSGPLICVSEAVQWTITSGRAETYRASTSASRGFCARCGSTLYWQADKRGPGFTLGSLDKRDGYRLTHVVHPEDRPDFYDVEPRDAAIRVKVAS